jgi:hypothetical protein
LENAGTFYTQCILLSSSVKQSSTVAEISEYIEDRVNEQIKWHSNRASFNKQRYHMLQIITIIAGSMVPLVNVIGGDNDFLPLSTRVVSAGLGALITIVTSITQLKKYDENWLSYRKTAESLKKEKFMFLHDVGEYSTNDEEQKKRLFVQKIETILMGGSAEEHKKDKGKGPKA